MEAGGTGGQVGAIATGSVTAGGHAHDVGTNVGARAWANASTVPWRPAADCRWLGSI